MPNWCENILIIEGNDLLLIKFAKFAKTRITDEGEKPYTQLLDFNKFIPYPEEMIHQDRIRELAYHLSHLPHTTSKEKFIKLNNISKEELGEIMLFNLGQENTPEDWFGWHTVHWGTKWNSRCYGKNPVKVDKNIYIYNFETAWSSPIQVIGAMTTIFPELTFTLLYGEGGNDFSGLFRINSVKIIENVQSRYKKNWSYPATFMRKYKLTKCKKALGYEK